MAIANKTSVDRFRSLDVLRGLAAVSVVLYHATMQWEELRNQVALNPSQASLTEWLIYLCGCGYLGVPVFFVISGYCICSAAVRHQQRGYPNWRYFRRRFQRIFPPYWICLAVFLAFCWVPSFGISIRGLTPTQWAGNLMLFEEWRPHVMGPLSTQYINPVAWTLCYEEQFYLLVGIILIAWPRAMFSIFTVLTVLNVVYLYGRFVDGLQPIAEWIDSRLPLDGFIFDKHWLFFACGIGLFVLKNSQSSLRLSFFPILALLLLWEIRQMDWATNRYQSRVAAFSVAFLLGLIATLGTESKNTWPMRCGVWLGERTYSIYLIHLPICLGITALVNRFLEPSPATTLAAGVPLAVLGSICSGAVFFHFVERKFQPSRHSSKLAMPA